MNTLEKSRRKVGGGGGALWGLGKTAILAPKVSFYQGFGHFGKPGIWRYGGEGGALWGLGKTAILLEKCRFTRVWRASGGDTTARAAHSGA